jgi:maltokinase
MTVDPAWLAGRRWYGANDRQLRLLAVVDSEPVAPGLEWRVLEAHFADGGTAHYQLFWDERADDDGSARPEAARWLFPELEIASARLLGGEQSNTSVVVEPGPAVLKVFRRVGPEPNPDAEVVRRLWDSGFRGVPEPLGECRRPVAGVVAATAVDLAVARRFLAGSRDGWDLALRAADFTDEARQLGGLTAAMHLALARALGTSPLDGAAATGRMLAHARRVLGDSAPVAPLQRLADQDVGAAIRTHGDYHLGQVLAHDGRWFVLDFEGEPARPVAERIAPSSPLRDVAGMVRSFAYAAAVAGHDSRWERDCRRAFVDDGYLGAPGIEALLPPHPQPVIDAYELDKAVYEVGYERANRPDWVAIPLAAVERLTGGAD